MSPASQPLQPLSEILGELADNPAERVSLDDLMRRFGGRALGAMLLIFGLLCMLPLPPGRDDDLRRAAPAVRAAAGVRIRPHAVAARAGCAIAPCPWATCARA
jgi:hypothetical protein